MREVVPTLRQRGAVLLAITAAEDLLDVATAAGRLPAAVAAHLTPLVAVVAGQVLAWRLALAREHHPDRPPGLQKVTQTY